MERAWSRLPKEHPFTLSDRDIRRTITRLKHWILNTENPDPTELRHVSTILNHLGEAQKEIENLKIV